MTNQHALGIITLRRILALATVVAVALLAWPGVSWQGGASAQTVPSPVPTETSTLPPSDTPETPIPTATVAPTVASTVAPTDTVPGPAASDTPLAPQPSPTPAPAPGIPPGWLVPCLIGIVLAALLGILVVLLGRRRREPPAAARGSSTR